MLRLPYRVAQATLLPLLSSLALGQVTAEPGVQTAAILDVGDRAYATLTDGGYVSFDGLSFERYDAAGSLIQTYGSLSSYAFPSFVEVTPDEAFAYVGESSNGDLYTVDLGAGTVGHLSNLAFNFDLAFDTSPGFAYVSAALGGFGLGNDILRLDLTTGQWLQVAHVSGPSGPLAVNGAGDLYYVTAYEGVSWPPPLEDEDLLLWTDAQLDAGQVLSEADASYLTDALDGGGDLEFDQVSGDLYLAHTNFQGLANEVLRISATGAVQDSLGASFTHISNLELSLDDGAAVLAPFQPAGARLHLNNVDFGGTIRDRVTLAPRRSTTTFQGPTNGQPGQASVTILDGVPNGFVSLMLARSSFLRGQEVVVDLGWGVPAFFMVDPSEVWRRTTQLPLDAAGSLTLTYQQPAGWTGTMTFQALLFDGSGAPVGTSTYVVTD
jgi:hypothetical protein